MIVGLAITNNGREPVQSTESDWSTGVPIPLARSEMPAAVIDGKIYVVGGFYEGSRVDRFDPGTQTWTRLAELPVAVHHPGVAALDGILYVAGGYDPRDHHANRFLWAYLPESDNWRLLAPLPEARGALGLVGIDGSVYAVGGAFENLGGPVSDELLRYHVAENEWQSLTPMPTGREHLAVVAIAGKIYAIGGRANGDEGATFGGANELYDPATDSWTKLAALPVARSGLAGVAVENSVIVLGGERGRSLYNDVNRYNVETGEWDTLSPLGVARHGVAAAYFDGTIYAIAGSTQAGRIQNVDLVETLSLNAPASASPVAP